jgi:hypothetical protein
MSAMPLRAAQKQTSPEVRVGPLTEVEPRRLLTRMNTLRATGSCPHNIVCLPKVHSAVHYPLPEFVSHN